MTQHTNRDPRKKIIAIVGGILLSLAGLGLMAAAYFLFLAAGTELRLTHQLGYLLFALAGFLVSAAGSELRLSAWRTRTEG
jgi:hypothetical protein